MVESGSRGAWKEGRKRICLPCKGCFCSPESSTSGVEEGTWRVFAMSLEVKLDILDRDTCSDGNRIALPRLFLERFGSGVVGLIGGVKVWKIRFVGACLFTCGHSS